MERPAIPANEEDRLRALGDTGLLETPPEPVFDALVRLAAELLAAPMSMLSLIDRERQWFKASWGVEPGDLPREIALGAHVVASGEPLLVADAFHDPRFCDHPLVLGGPCIRAYAGVPIGCAEQLVLGTLCVADWQPRDFGPPALERLGLLASQAAAQIDLRRRERLLAEGRDGLLLLQAVLARLPGTQVGVFGERLRIERAFGHPAGPGALTVPERLTGRSILDLAPPDQRAASIEAARRCLHGQRSLLRASKGGRVLEVSFEPLSSGGGRARGLAISVDVTERDSLQRRVEQQEELLRTSRLAAELGFAINQPLTSMVGDLDLALSDLGDLAANDATPKLLAVADALHDVREGADRIRKIVRTFQVRLLAG